MGRHTYRTLHAHTQQEDLAHAARTLDLVIVGIMVGVLIAVCAGWIS